MKTITTHRALLVCLLFGVQCSSTAQESIAGVGIALGVDKETSSFKIVRIIPGGPAAKAGLTAGQLVDKADGVSLNGKSLNECINLLRGAVGTKVTLHVVDLEEHLTNKVELTRDRIVIANTAAKLGEPAAALKVKQWVKGKPVNVRDGNAVYVIEFWATWCGPCRVSIPHLTELQKRWKGAVVFVSISDEAPSIVKPFVEGAGDKMDYTVACDDDRMTYASYMEAYAQSGIPTAFVVGRDGRVLWVGHPMSGLDTAVEQAVARKLTAPPVLGGAR